MRKKICFSSKTSLNMWNAVLHWPPFCRSACSLRRITGHFHLRAVFALGKQTNTKLMCCYFQKLPEGKWGGLRYPIAFGRTGCLAPIGVVYGVIFPPSSFTHLTSRSLNKCVYISYWWLLLCIKATHFPSVLAINFWMLYEGRTGFT